MCGKDICLQEGCQLGRDSGQLIGIKLRVGSPALRIAGNIHQASNRFRIAGIKIDILIEMSGIPLMSKRRKQGCEIICRRGVQVDTIISIVVKGRYQVHGRAQIILKRFVNIPDITAYVSGYGRKVGKHSLFQIVQTP